MELELIELYQTTVQTYDTLSTRFNISKNLVKKILAKFGVVTNVQIRLQYYMDENRILRNKIDKMKTVNEELLDDIDELCKQIFIKKCLHLEE
jgi:hypothetical protein